MSEIETTSTFGGSQGSTMTSGEPKGEDPATAMLEKAYGDEGTTIPLAVSYTALIDDRVFKKMQVLSDFAKGAWICDGSSLKLGFVPEAEIPDDPKFELIAAAVADMNTDKEAVLYFVRPVELEVRLESRNEKAKVRTRSVKVIKPNVGITLVNLELKS